MRPVRTRPEGPEDGLLDKREDLAFEGELSNEPPAA